MLRTRHAGSLRAADIGTTVTLTGWVDRRRDHGGIAFIDLRDASGIAQITIREEVAHELRSEYCIKVTGVVDESSTAKANSVLSVQPTAGANVALDTPITLTYAPGTGTVPNFYGQTRSAAQAQADREGLSVKFTEAETTEPA